MQRHNRAYAATRLLRERVPKLCLRLFACAQTRGFGVYERQESTRGTSGRQGCACRPASWLDLDLPSRPAGYGSLFDPSLGGPLRGHLSFPPRSRPVLSPRKGGQHDPTATPRSDALPATRGGNRLLHSGERTLLLATGADLCMGRSGRSVR